MYKYFMYMYVCIHINAHTETKIFHQGIVFPRNKIENLVIGFLLMTYFLLIFVHSFENETLNHNHFSKWQVDL